MHNTSSINALFARFKKNFMHKKYIIKYRSVPFLEVALDCNIYLFLFSSDFSSDLRFVSGYPSWDCIAGRRITPWVFRSAVAVGTLSNPCSSIRLVVCNHCSNWTWVVEEILDFFVLGCVLRTAGSSIIWNYADPLTSLELLNYYLTLTTVILWKFCKLSPLYHNVETN